MKSKGNKEINTSPTLIKAFSIALIMMMVSAAAYTQQLKTITHTYAKGWNLVAVPLQAQDNSPYAVFDEVAAPFWFYDYQGGLEVGVDEPGFTNIDPGRGYNLLLADSTTISVTGATVAINTPFHITLAKGWNIISTPWRMEVEWADSRISISDGTTTAFLSTAISNQQTESVLYSLDPATEAYTTLQPNDTSVNYLSPWQGYLLFSMIDDELVMEEPPPDNTYPVVIIHAPIDGTRVSLITDIIGTIEDENLAEQRLEYESVELGQPITLATGEDEITNATIGKLDPTLLLNGMVNLRLIVEDIAGNISLDEKTVLIDGANKLGVFRISFVDLQVPVSGIPITIKRNYDSRVHTISRDFGYGWWLEIGVDFVFIERKS